MESNLKLTSIDTNVLKEPLVYRKLIGKLIHLNITRPDVTYAVSVLSQFMEKPSKTHLNSVYRVLKYLKNASGQGIFFPANNKLELIAYSD